MPTPKPKAEPAQLHIASLTDRSLAGYKAFVRSFVLRINPHAPNNMTDAEWEEDWHAFWAAAGQPTAPAEDAPPEPDGKQSSMDLPEGTQGA
jgi:hypothetical protein